MSTRCGSRLLVRAIVTACALVVAAGCGGSDSSSESESIETDTASETTRPADLSADQIRGLLLGDTLPGQVDEQIIIDCMKEAGFEFFPTQASPEGPGLSAAQPTLAQVERDGYGILIETSADDLTTSSEPDPNIAYRDSLTPAERTAYENVFSGGASEVDQVTPDSCLGQQMAALDAAGPPISDELYIEILDEFQELVDADPSMVEAREQWSTCMRSAGHPYGSRDDILTYLFSIANSAEGVAPTAAQQSEERTLAVADFGCSQAERDARPGAEDRAAEKIIDRYGTDA